MAKVAQKLVDGGGTLTNPGNLTVTGVLNVGTKGANTGGITFYSSLPWGGDASKQSATGTNKDGIFPNGVHFLHQNGTQGVGISFDGIYKCGTNAEASPNITLATTNSKGNVNVLGGLTASSNISTTGTLIGKLPADTWIHDSKDKPRLNLGNGADGSNYYRCNTGGKHIYRDDTDTNGSGLIWCGPITCSNITIGNKGQWGPTIILNGDCLARNYYNVDGGPVNIGYAGGKIGINVFGNANITDNLTIGGSTLTNTDINSLHEIINWYNTVKNKIYVKNGNTYIEMQNTRWTSHNCGSSTKDKSYNLGCNGTVETNI